MWQVIRNTSRKTHRFPPLRRHHLQVCLLAAPIIIHLDYSALWTVKFEFDAPFARPRWKQHN